jgi:glutamate formiminotransferase
MRAHTTWLTEEEKRLIVDEALGILATVGFRAARSRVLPLLADAGAEVDPDSGTVRLPPDLVRAALARCPRSFLMAGAAPEHDVLLEEGAPWRFTPSGCGAKTLDHVTGERRASTLEDVRLSTAINDELPELGLMWQMVSATDVPVERRELLEYYTILRETDKHVTFVDCPSQVEAVKRIFEVLAGDLARFRERPRVSSVVTAASPLQVDGHVLDVHVDPDHNRSVFTLVGDDAPLIDALLASIACARDRIDLRLHEGAHPRIGAADVVPIVALDTGDEDRARACALLLAERIGAELELPVFLYGESAPGRGPAFFRRGGPGELQRRIDAGELRPDFGPSRIDERAGGVIVGARRPLIAFNVDLETDDVDVARAIAAVVREKGGGFPGVRALGVALPSARRAQVSMNVEDYEAAPLADIVERVRREAQARGTGVSGAELVGLMPAGAAVAAARAVLEIDGLDSSSVLELRLLERLKRRE